MIINVPGRGPLTEEESSRLFFALLKDDTEDAPWMVMGSLQWSAASDFYQSLREYAAQNRPDWFVAGMTPILYRWPGLEGKRQLAPDVFVAFAPNRARYSYDLDVEGDFPPFVLEIVSPSSARRDQIDKRLAYDQLGVREYAMFTPREGLPSDLAGYRRNAVGSFESWPTDDQGRLWSEVLELYLFTLGEEVRATTRDGTLLPSLREALTARRDVDAENERLRREIERLRAQRSQESNES